MTISMRERWTRMLRPRGPRGWTLRRSRRPSRLGGGVGSSAMRMAPFRGYGLSMRSCVQHDGTASGRKRHPSARWPRVDGRRKSGCIAIGEQTTWYAGVEKRLVHSDTSWAVAPWLIACVSRNALHGSSTAVGVAAGTHCSPEECQPARKCQRFPAT